VPLVISTPTQDECYPPIDVQLTLTGFTSKNYRYIDVPAAVNSPKPYLGLYRDACTGKAGYEFFDWGDIGNLVAAGAAGKLSDSASINAWRRAQPVTTLTAAQLAFAKATVAAADAAAPSFKVAVNGAALTRPVYAAVNGARRTTSTGALAAKVGDVKVGTRCDAVLTVEGKYMGVAGQPNEAKPGTALPAATVALCEPL
jgi:hypothetical protein